MTLSKFSSQIQELSESRESLPFSKDKLISALKELDELIEMDNVKELISFQLKKIIYLLISGKKLNTEMFHTLICGPSGCGKSSLARILAKIWESINVIQSTNTKIFVINKSKLDVILSSFSVLYRNRQKYNHSTEQQWNNLKKELDDFVEEKYDIPNDEFIRVASRDSFVAEFTGQTEPKSREFLEKNRGKCIVIEEAYSLYNGPNDEYGIEALNMLNRWMEEEASSNIFIFVGYKELIKKLYDVQPGIERRFLWIFDIEGYTPAGLTSIFLKQCEKDNMVLDSDLNINDFFTKNITEFPHFGGDTLRLEKICSTIYYAQSFDGLLETHSEIVINDSLIYQAFEIYMETKI